MDAALLSRSEPVQKLLSHIIIKYLAQLYCVCFVWSTLDANQVGHINFDWMDIEENYPQMIWLKYEAFGVNQTNIDDLVRLGIDNGCQAFIASPGAAIDFLNSFENVRYTAENRYHLMHVVALPTSHDEAKEYVDQILKHSTVQDIPNILIVSPSSRKNEKMKRIIDNSFDLITSRFVTRHNGHEARILDTFNIKNETFVENADLFPDKFSNLENRIMRVALFNYKPYTIWDTVPAGLGNANALDSDEEKTLLIDGTETLMIMMFCELYNCTLAISLGLKHIHIQIVIRISISNDLLYLILDEVSEWGAISDNMTGDGVLGALVERRADIGISALYSWHHEHQFLEFSSSMSRSGVTCICPKPSLLSGWLLPAEPFSVTMWTVELISFLSVFVMIATIKSVLKNQNIKRNTDIMSSFLQTLAIFLLQCTKIASKHVPEMIIGLVALMACQLIANAYSGGLSSIMTVPRYEAPIETAHELVERNFEWGATHDAWTFSILDATPPDLIKLVNMFKAIPFEALSARTKTRDFCFSVERLPYGHYAVGDYIDENSLNYLRIMHYDIYFEYCVAMFYKTWPFKSVFDLMVLHIVESGIQKYWELMTVAQHTNSKIQLGISISRDREKTGPLRLNFDHVSGAFVFLGFGLACATFVFILELAWHRCKRTRMFTERRFTVKPLK